MYSDLIFEGGPVIWALTIAATTATAVILFKLFQFYPAQQLGKGDFEQAHQLLDQQRKPEALLLVQALKNPRAKVYTQALRLFSSAPMTMSDIRVELTRIARRELTELGSHLKILEVIATTAPLLGLLGTVLGMIEAFRAMELAGAQVDPATLSGGIWQALLTTAAGLVVAIPVSLCHSYLQRRVEREANSLEDDIGRLVTHFLCNESEKTMAQEVQP